MPGEHAASPRSGVERELESAAHDFVRLLRTLLRNVYALDPEDPVARGLPVAQLRLTTLLGERPHTVSEVAREMHISVSGATQLVQRLCAAGLVARLVEHNDRRVRRLALTETGRELVRRRTEARLRAARELLARLSAADRDQALRALRTLAE